MRGEHRKTTIILGSLICILLLALLSTWLYLKHIDALPIKQVNVIGDFNAVGKTRLIKLIEPNVLHGMFNINNDNIDKALQQFPSIESITTDRDFPHTVNVFIKRYPLFARLPNGTVITQTGKQFKPILTFDIHQLPLIDFPISQLAFAEKHLRLFQSNLTPAGLAISKIWQDGGRQWVMDVAQRSSDQAEGRHAFLLMLGNTDVKQRLQRFAQAYPLLIKHNQNQSITSVDLRYKTGMAVRWQNHGKK